MAGTAKQTGVKVAKSTSAKNPKRPAKEEELGVKILRADLIGSSDDVLARMNRAVADDYRLEAARAFIALEKQWAFRENSFVANSSTLHTVAIIRSVVAILHYSCTTAGVLLLAFLG